MQKICKTSWNEPPNWALCGPCLVNRFIFRLHRDETTRMLKFVSFSWMITAVIRFVVLSNVCTLGRPLSVSVHTIRDNLYTDANFKMDFVKYNKRASAGTTVLVLERHSAIRAMFARFIHSLQRLGNVKYSALCLNTISIFTQSLRKFSQSLYFFNYITFLLCT